MGILNMQFFGLSPRDDLSRRRDVTFREETLKLSGGRGGEMRRISGLESPLPPSPNFHPTKERPEHLSGMQSRLCLELAAPKELLCRFQAAKSQRLYWTTQPLSTQMVCGCPGPYPTAESDLRSSTPSPSFPDLPWEREKRMGASTHPPTSL